MKRYYSPLGTNFILILVASNFLGLGVKACEYSRSKNEEAIVGYNFLDERINQKARGLLLCGAISRNGNHIGRKNFLSHEVVLSKKSSDLYFHHAIFIGSNYFVENKITKDIPRGGVIEID